MDGHLAFQFICYGFCLGAGVGFGMGLFANWPGTLSTMRGGLTTTHIAKGLGYQPRGDGKPVSPPPVGGSSVTHP